MAQVIGPQPNIMPVCINALRPRQNGHHFIDGVFDCIFVNGNLHIEITLKFARKYPIDNRSSLLQANETMMAQFNNAYARHPD